ncbi:hypothetical protein ACQP0C_25970 [Nocardia sp. CA-129566]|uniref:hypothetical protein n=1 Tax=Nocardia sp. CA-129566 TaxID=3239976 RepID=UPI003D9904D2
MGELPDSLPVVLDFIAATGNRSLLLDHRTGSELLRLVLAKSDTPYSLVLEALCAPLR